MSIWVRTMTQDDRAEVASLIQVSLNYWYQTRGRPPIFSGNPRAADVFFQVYDALEPGCAAVAEDSETGLLAGSCFYHPRPHHVGLGIMNVHPNYFGTGAGGALLRHIIALAEEQGKPVRLTSSALNLDSFSLYTRYGFVPRQAFQDMFLTVPAEGLNAENPGASRVRDAALLDLEGMAVLEMAVSGITREMDYRFAIENPAGCLHAAVYESTAGAIDGFMISCRHPSFHMLGPCVARSEPEAEALILAELDRFRGKTPVFVVPADRPVLVRRMYGIGARNCELHFCQVRGAFQPFNGISMPSYLPETG
jgi:GNAT superfamily N-acetyltransferase